MTSTATGQLTRAEDAYAHLASFGKGDVVDVADREFSQPGTVITAQEDGRTLGESHLSVRGCGSVLAVTVADLLGGMTVTLQDEVARGNVRYFDQAGYAARNG